MATRDNRRHPRVPVDRPVVLFVGEKHIYGSLTDISHSGMGVMANYRPDIDERFELHFELKLDDHYENFVLQVMAVHCFENVDMEGNHIGVEIAESDVHYDEVYTALVNR